MVDAEDFFEETPCLGSRSDLVFDTFVDALKLEGDVAECGVYRGETARQLVGFIEAHEIDKVVHLFDTFSGLPEVIEDFERRQAPENQQLRPGEFCCTEAHLQANLAPYERFELHEGMFAHTLPRWEGRLCFIHADADLYRSTIETLRFAERVLVKGGLMVVDDVGNPRWPGVERAVEEEIKDLNLRIERPPGRIQCVLEKL